MNATAELFVVVIGIMLLIAVVLATKRTWCEQAPPPAPVSPEESQRAALAALAALEPPVAVVIMPAVVLPHFPYAARGRASETLVCAICLEALRDGEACSEVPGCRHVFHGDCVGAWVRSKGSSCPLCRTKIAPRSGGGAAAAAADDTV